MMINITKKNDEILMTGHTYPDICAAVSSVMYASVNMLDKYDEHCMIFEDNTDEDYVKIIITKHDKIIDMVITNMFDMFNDIYEDGNQDKIHITTS